LVFFGWVFYWQPCLEAELFCDIYYLRNLCNSTKFPAWPIAHPVRLLKEVLAAWRTEVDKKPATMSIDDAYMVSSSSISVMCTNMCQCLVDGA
jgi:hypothetical protein